MKIPFVFQRNVLNSVLAGLFSLTALTGQAMAQSRYYSRDRDAPPPPPSVGERSRYDERSRPVERSYRYERQPEARVKRSSGYERDYGGRDYSHSHSRVYDRDYDQDYSRRVYLSRPRSSFGIVYGTGYAGQGYYYGPADCAYHYEAPGVRYFSSRDAAYRAYPVYRGGGYSSGYDPCAVQRVLYSRGYYRGAIDGQFGPECRRSIVRCQSDYGLSPTGVVTVELLRLLGM